MEKIVSLEEKKAFALTQIVPYYNDNSLCGIDSSGDCVYLTFDNKMCIAGKNMLNPEKYGDDDIRIILNSNTQDKVFKPESVDILTKQEWQSMQSIHDSIARKTDFLKYIKELNLFTFEELEKTANNLN